MEIQLRKFDMNEIKDDKVVVLIGKRDTGKSFLCRDLLYHHKDINGKHSPLVDRSLYDIVMSNKTNKCIN